MMDYISRNREEVGSRGDTLIRLWLVELSGRWFHPWIRMHRKRAEDEADVAFGSWFGPGDCRSQLITTSLKILHVLFVGEGCAAYPVVWFVPGHLRQRSLRWEWLGSPEASSLFPLHSQLWNSGWGIALEIGHLFSETGCTLRCPPHLTRLLRGEKWESNFRWGRCQVSFKKIYWP